MKRLTLLKTTANKEITAQNLERKVNREKEDLEFEVVKLKRELKEKQDAFEDRMGSDVAFTPNDIEASFGPITKIQTRISLIEDILEEYYSAKA